jgi:hypothetical protein
MKMNRTFRLATVAFLVTFALVPLTSHAAPITSGDLVIYRVGDGTAALGTAATAVFLDEYSPLGTLVQSIPLPTSGVTALTATGNSTTEGVISVSQNGTPQATLVFTGYRADVGTATPSSATPATVNRVIGTIGLGGLANTTVALTDPTGAIRSAASTDGSSLFYIGTAAAVRYVGTPGPAATSVSIDARNSRQVLMSGNKLFASNGSTSITGKVQDYGNLPTTTTAANPDVVLATADAVNGFALFDLDAGVAGDDTLYALSTVEGLLRKYSLVGGVWTANGSIATGAQDLTGYAAGSSVNLFLTSGTTLSSEIDNSGYNTSITGTITTLATASANEGFRGIAVLIPEPSSFCLAIVGTASLLAIRRRRS